MSPRSRTVSARAITAGSVCEGSASTVGWKPTSGLSPLPALEVAPHATEVDRVRVGSHEPDALGDGRRPARRGRDPDQTAGGCEGAREVGERVHEQAGRVDLDAATERRVRDD